MTPHNEAAAGDYAPTILIAGDPLRSEWIARSFLEAPRQVNGIRGALGFTGTCGDIPVSVHTTGIGSPSLAIYVHELLEVYGARTLIRVGTCGGLQEDVRIRDLVTSQAAGTDSAMNRQIFGSFEFAPSPDFGLLRRSADAAADLGLRHHVGPTVSSDIFYHPAGPERFDVLRRHGVIAVDMETAALYTLAARFGARALSICTVVDNLVTGDAIAESERQEVFRDMVRLALAVGTDLARGTGR